jgi:hypothetical protein
MIRFNILSPIELRIFFDKNSALINIVYILLSIYAIFYLFNWGNKFYKIKRPDEHYMKIK